MIKIEILSLENKTARAAYYFPQTALPGAVDESRVPAGNRLSGPEIQALKDGELFEWVLTIRRRPRKSFADVQADFVDKYASEQIKADREYNRLYSGSGNAWDGSNWS